MKTRTVDAWFVVVMVVVIACVDVFLFRHEFAERLIANVAIVVVFVIFYLTFLKNR
jgi:hypothetical protein